MKLKDGEAWARDEAKPVAIVKSLVESVLIFFDHFA